MMTLLARPAAAELVLHYDFSERSGKVLHDRSGKGHDGTITGAQWVTTESDAALDFDGANDFIAAGNPPELQIGGALSLTLWVRLIPSPQDADRYLMSKFGWSIYLDEKAQPHMETRNAKGDKWIDLGATRPIDAGEWNLIAAVHDPVAHQMRMYVNGQRAGERSRADETIGRAGETAFYVGKFAPWPPELNGLVADVKIYNHAVSDDEVAALYKQHPDDALVVTPYRFTASPRHYYREKKMGVDVQLFTRSPALAAKKFNVWAILGRHLEPVIKQTNQRLDQNLRAYVDLPMPDAPGAYPLHMIVYAEDERLAKAPQRTGPVIAQTTLQMHVKAFREADLKWQGSQAGISRKVLAPWTPLKVNKQQETVAVSLSGRRYEFKPDSLVSAAFVGEHNLLAAPVQLKFHGKLLDQAQLTVTEASDDRVRLTHQNDSVTVHTTIDYDGLIWFDWEITSPPDPLAQLTLEIPLAGEYAQLLWHNRYSEHPWAEQKPGLLSKDGFAGKFLPAIWLGNEDHGLQWLAESDEGWRLKDPNRAIEVVRDGDYVVLRVNMIDAPAQVDGTISGGFGLHATPVKPWGKTLWDYRFRVETNFGEPLAWYGPHFDSFIEKHGIGTITVFENWNNAHSYVRTTPKDEDKLRAIIKMIQRRGPRALLYFGGFISSLAPESQFLWDECVKTPTSGWTDYNYPPVPRQKLFKVCYNSIWQDLLADGMERCMKEFDLDGLYLDGVGDVVGCTNTHHGCGYVAPDGSVRPTYPIRATRKLMRRIYTIVKSHKPDGQVKLHQSGQMIAPILSFATSYWDGEQFTGYQDKFLLNFLPLDTFRTEFMGRQWGVAAEMLQYRLPGTEHQKKGLFLLHDVNDEAGYETNKKLFEMFDAFGRSEATWLPYWSHDAYVKVDPPQANASLYRHPRNGVVVMVTNTDKNANEVSVQLNLDQFKELTNATAVDAITGEDVQLTAGRFTYQLEALHWKMIWVKP